MTTWIVIGSIDVLVLLGFRLLGGLGGAASAFEEWGCAAGRVGSVNCN
jgi:hypothetical protein